MRKKNNLAEEIKKICDDLNTKNPTLKSAFDSYLADKKKYDSMRESYSGNELAVKEKHKVRFK